MKMKAKSINGCLVALLVLIVYCFKNMAGISIEVLPYDLVKSDIHGGFLALHNKDKMPKSSSSTNEYYKRFNLATVEIWRTIRRKCRNGFITLSIKSMHFFISKLMQFRYSISVPTTSTNRSSSRMIFWVTLTRAVSSMANDTTL